MRMDRRSSLVKVPLLIVIAILALGLLAPVFAQPLSSQVLQLLNRINTWTARNNYYDFRLIRQTPADTVDRLYNINGGLYWNGSVVVGAGGGITAHALLSATHSDSTANVPLRGALILGQGGAPTWSRLSLGADGMVLRSDGTDAVWSTDGSGLTALNAAGLGSGTVPLARLTGIGNAQIDGAAAIGWAKIDKAGSNLADLTTRSAADLSSGTLLDARLSANVSLFGASVTSGEIAAATILFSNLAANGCGVDQYPKYDGVNWVCGTFIPGAGTVTSVAMTVPAIFALTGSPIVGSGTLGLTLATQTANLVWAGPSGGGPVAPLFRSLVYADLPTSAVAAGTYPKVTVNAQGIVTAASSQITLTTDVTGALPLVNGGTNLNAAADDSVLLSGGAAWAAAAVPNCTAGLTYATATNTFSCAGGAGPHAILSGTHNDTVAAAVVRGDLMVGSAVPLWNRLPIGGSSSVLYSNGSDATWTSVPSLSGLSVVMPLGSLTVGTGGGGTSKIELGSHYVPFSGSGGNGIDYGATVVESFMGTHGALYAHGFGGTFTPGLAATTVAATMRIYAFTGSTAVTTYGLLVDANARFDTGIQVGATGTMFPSIVRGTDTWDPASVANGAATGVALTVTGATTTSTCFAALSTLGTNHVAITGHPSAADTVRVVITNNSGGAVDAASGTVSAVCFQ